MKKERNKERNWKRGKKGKRISKKNWKVEVINE